MDIRNRLIKSYHFYNKYHKNLYNKIIHYCTIPLIIFSLFCTFNYIPHTTFNLNGTSNDILKYILTFNIITWIIIINYQILYMIFDICSSLYMFVLIYITCVLANIYYYCFDGDKSFIGIIIVFCIHIISWIMQILGHKLFEKNSPAFIHGFIQAFVMAPFFVLLDLLFYLGLRKNLHETLIITEPINYHTTE